MDPKKDDDINIFPSFVEFTAASERSSGNGLAFGLGHGHGGLCGVLDAEIDDARETRILLGHVDGLDAVHHAAAVDGQGQENRRGLESSLSAGFCHFQYGLLDQLPSAGGHRIWPVP